MNTPKIKYCLGTLTAGYTSYSITCLNRVFNGRKVNHLLPYDSPATNDATDILFLENRMRMAISGVQEKFSLVLDKNLLRLTNEGEQGTYILKPIPNIGKNPDQKPANEHLTMQIARQVFGIETAENALIFFKNGQPAYITKRFDVKEDGSKWATEDFSSLSGRTTQTHGEHYKYIGSYSALFDTMKKFLPAYKLEAPKLFKLIVFNYLFSNGDAHFKNFSILETPLGDFRLSPAYDLINSRIHIEDYDFALEDGLLPKNLAKGNIREQFNILASLAGLSKSQTDRIFSNLLSNSEKIAGLINTSFLSDRFKRNYLQAYQIRHKQLSHLPNMAPK